MNVSRNKTFLFVECWEILVLHIASPLQKWEQTNNLRGGGGGATMTLVVKMMKSKCLPVGGLLVGCPARWGTLLAPSC
jgi:hypothetical protein